MKFPKMVKIEQIFTTDPIRDIPGEIRSRFEAVGASNIIHPGRSVAVTAGSRGVRDIAVILASVVNELKRIGAKPFIVPAMGSHGGATAEGQVDLLAQYGVTEEAMGAPIRSSMDVVVIGQTSDGVPVPLDRRAAEADHIVVVNRVKPHTDFEGEIESGLMKMMAIGLGKQVGAARYHNEFMRRGHVHVITSAARVILEASRIALGIGVVENQKDETQLIRVIPAADIENAEKKMLARAKTMLPRIPFDPIDILIVDEMGKNFSGTGMDQNVIARTVIPYHNVPATPRITRIIVRDLSEESGGNALGIGNADFTTRRLTEKIDPPKTRMNTITSSCPEIMRIPASYDTDREILEAAFQTISVTDARRARIVRVKNTLHLQEMYISDSMLPEARERTDLGVIGPVEDMKFTDRGDLPPWEDGLFLI